MSRSCANLVIHCIDFRLARFLNDWAEATLGNRQYDLAAMAGAQKALLDADTQAALLKQIGLSIRLHGVRRVHLLGHLDCGAYRETLSGASPRAEKARHLADLKEAKRLIETRFDPVAVNTYLVSLDSGVSEVGKG